MKRKLVIESGGVAMNTKVLCDGVHVAGVTKIEWAITGPEGVSGVRLTLENVPLQLETHVEFMAAEVIDVRDE